MRYVIIALMLFCTTTVAAAESSLLCATRDPLMQPAPCHPLYDANCPIDICAIQYPNGGCTGQVQVNECDMYHEDGESFLKHYCAAYETTKVLWELYFGVPFPVAKSQRCERR
jgi:hypothetical protein